MTALLLILLVQAQPEQPCWFYLWFCFYYIIIIFLWLTLLSLPHYSRTDMMACGPSVPHQWIIAWDSLSLAGTTGSCMYALHHHTDHFPWPQW